MIIKTYDYNNKLNKYNGIFEQAVFFDIETTGLSHKFSNIISITLLLYIEKKFKIYQLFCENKPDEKTLLNHFKNLVEGKKYLITYNGNSFDIPFVTYKNILHGINIDFNEFIKIDLYNDIRHLNYKFNLHNLKLKTVENYFTLNRNDTFSGQDIILLYEAYKINQEKIFVELILNHNYEDVYNLPELFILVMNSYDKTLIFNDLIIKLSPNNISFKKNFIVCNFYIISKQKNDYIHHAINYDLNINAKLQTLEISIPSFLYKSENIKEIYYVRKSDFNISSFKTLQGLKSDIIPLKINNKILLDNIYAIITKVLVSIYKN